MTSHPTTIGNILSNVSRQSAVVFLTRGGALVLAISSTILLSRLLGPAGFGKFRLGSVVVQVLTTFCVLGLDRALMRYLPILETRNEDGKTLVIKAGSIVFALSLALSVGLVFGTPFLATSYFHSPQMANVLYVFSLQLPVLALFRFFSGAVTAAKRFDFASKITNILSPAVFLFLVALIALVYPNLYATIAARIVAQAVAGIALIVFLLRHFSGSRTIAPAAEGTFKSYLSLAMPLFLIGIGYQLLNQMDTLMLGFFTNEKEVGIYAVAFKVSAFVLIGLEILLPIVAPLFSQFRETRDTQSTEALFQTVTKWMCYSGLVIFVCIVVFRLELLKIFGKGFTAGTSALLVLAIGQFANAATGPTGVLLTMTGKQKWELANSLVMVAFNFLLNLVLIPRMGILGAAIATAISIATINAIKLIQVYLLFGLQAYNLKYLKGVVAIAGAGLVAYLLRGWLDHAGCSPYTIMPVGAIVLLTAATIGLWLLGLDQEDKTALVALRRR